MILKFCPRPVYYILLTYISISWEYEYIKENKLSSNWQQSWWTKLKIMTLQSINNYHPVWWPTSYLLNIDWMNYSITCIFWYIWFVCLIVFNATFNNVSVILWWSVLLVEDPGENHRPVSNHWQTLSQNVVHLALIEIYYVGLFLVWLLQNIAKKYSTYSG